MKTLSLLAMLAVAAQLGAQRAPCDRADGAVPAEVEAVLMEQSRDAYSAALAERTAARSDRAKAESEMEGSAELTTERFVAEAKIESDESPEIVAVRAQVDAICSEIVSLRATHARTPRGTAREIKRLQEETRVIRRALSGDARAFRQRYVAETARVVAIAQSPEKLARYVANQLAAVINERDALAAGK